MSSSDRVEVLEVEARYARERVELYRAKMYGQRPTTMSRLRELERIHQGAEARLGAARLERAASPPT
ncbi:MAG TPA: hypothetical protein VMA83_07940 [Solirubrobacteraceae bacterium]|nr:hypothetical protein [Solirubrobacteraceae bacterium]